jgi:hypothetical protein
MKWTIQFTALCLALAALTAPALAQSGGAGGALQSSGAQPLGDHMGQNNMTQDQFNQLSDYVDQAKRLTKEDKAKGKTEDDLKKEDKAAAADLAKALAVPCDVTDAELVAQSSGGMRGYEAACGDGMGYFLVSEPAKKSYAISCFTARARHDLDAAKGKTTDAQCQLPANADIDAGAGRVLAGLNVTCAVRKISWMGRSDTNNSEYNEAACDDGKGYVLVTPEPGSIATPHALGCADAAVQGIRCKLTAVAQSAQPALTLQTFKDALKQHNVPCDAGGERVIGQENLQKRYVVEFKCPQQPGGLVAFIPVGVNTTPFETTDCATAAKRGLACKLNATQ